MEAGENKYLTPRVIVAVLVFVVGIPLLPILIPGRWDWWEAWIFAGVSILGFAVSRFVAGRRNPGLLAERSHFLDQPDAVNWDKALSPLVGLGGGLIPLAAGIEALWRGTDPFSLPFELAALGVILIGYFIGSYALYANRFFSGMVRIQSERGHQVVSDGPYAWVRHPGYAGALLTYLATPVFLDSYWAFLPAGFLIFVLAVRTALEDRFLQDSLDGYRAYSARVRYRLLPGVW